MVAYLTKSDASEGFTQIINFLNGSYIKYALTVNPNIYVSCIKQFWTTVAIKQFNDVTRLQALVDKKKVVVTEAEIREVLRLDDAEGVDCLPNEDIFTALARMGYEKPSTKLTFYKAFFSIQWKFLIHTILQSMSAKRTSWNEFRSSMASAIICLSTCRKFNFSKYIFDSLVRNVDSTTKFYMYPRFLQLLIRKQVGDLSTHTTKYTSPTLTQKVFVNMKRVGKGLSKVETPLFEGMLVGQEIEEERDKDEHVEDVTAGRMIAEMDKDDDVVLMDDKEEDKKVEEAKEDEPEPAEVQEVVDVVTTAKLITEKKERSEELKPLKKKEQIKMDEEYARKLHAELNKDIEWDVAIDHIEKEDRRALQTINETPAEKATKRRKLNEEAEDLKRYLEIVPDEHDDVYTKATPLARKLILLVERRYPLSRFTLDQMLNAVRLQVEEESEVSLELLRFTRQQHQEGQHE
nr:hypothetical protein [Tanacetum cinerariifolium]